MINLITPLSPEQFLVLYLVLCVGILVICRWYVRIHDVSRSMPPLPVSSDVDAYEVAYMRGGENALTRVIMVSLAERGYLTMVGTSIVRTSVSPDPLAGVERTVYEWFSVARTAEEVFKSSLPNRVAGQCLRYEERLQAERLVSAELLGRAGAKAAMLAGLVIVAILGWRLLVSHGEEYAATPWLGFMSLGVAVVVCCSGRLTARGRAYVDQLKPILDRLRPSTGSRYALKAAVLGMSALKGTPYREFGALFEQSQSSFSAGCGPAPSCGG